MKGIVHHIARFGLLSATVAVVLTTAGTTSYADRSKRGISAARKAVPTNAIRYSTPTIGSMEVIVTALGTGSAEPKDGSVAETGAKTSVTRDTIPTESRITSARATSDVFTAQISIAADQPRIEIGIYNRLGKKMADVYTGPAGRGEHEYTTPISELPEGVYVCILQGGNFRRAAKFYLSR